MEGSGSALSSLKKRQRCKATQCRTSNDSVSEYFPGIIGATAMGATFKDASTCEDRLSREETAKAKNRVCISMTALPARLSLREENADIWLRRPVDVTVLARERLYDIGVTPIPPASEGVEAVACSIICPLVGVKESEHSPLASLTIAL